MKEIVKMMNEIKLGVNTWQGIEEGKYGIRVTNSFDDYFYDTIAHDMYLSGEEYLNICAKHGGKFNYVAGMVFSIENNCLLAIKELHELRDSRIILNKLAGK